jgi:hypothetical protein
MLFRVYYKLCWYKVAAVCVWLVFILSITYQYQMLQFQVPITSRPVIEVLIYHIK